MRWTWPALAVACLTYGVGCNSVPFSRNSQPASGVRVGAGTPTAADLVASLNDNARRVQSVECRDVDLDCTKGWESVGLRAAMVCQKPRSCRLVAKVMGNTAVDMGSNDQEFWYWLSKADPPYLFHCSHDDFSRGRARTPFPFQPDWVIEALGIAEYDPSKPYEVVPTAAGVDLVERTHSPQGEPVRKVTRLTRRGNQLQVTAHLLQDAQGREICSALIADAQQDPTTGAVLPRQVQLNWPAERIRMKMRFDRPTVNPPLTPDRVAVLFTRPALRDVPAYDLARGLDAPGLRPAGYR